MRILAILHDKAKLAKNAMNRPPGCVERRGKRAGPLRGRRSIPLPRPCWLPTGYQAGRAQPHSGPLAPARTPPVFLSWFLQARLILPLPWTLNQ